MLKSQCIFIVECMMQNSFIADFFLVTGPMWLVLVADADGFVPLMFKHKDELTIRSAKRKSPVRPPSGADELPNESPQSPNAEKWQVISSLLNERDTDDSGKFYCWHIRNCDLLLDVSLSLKYDSCTIVSGKQGELFRRNTWVPASLFCWK